MPQTKTIITDDVLIKNPIDGSFTHETKDRKLSVDFSKVIQDKEQILGNSHNSGNLVVITKDGHNVQYNEDTGQATVVLSKSDEGLSLNKETGDLSFSVKKKITIKEAQGESGNTQPVDEDEEIQENNFCTSQSESIIGDNITITIQSC